MGRRLKELSFGAGIALFTAFLAVALSACGDNEASTAGVLTETESGRTLALTLNRLMVSDSTDNPGSVKFALTRIVDGRTTLYDSMTVGYNEYAVFKDVPDIYGVVASTQLDPDKSLIGAEILKTNESDTLFVEVSTPATLKISTAYDSLEVGDTLCITGTLSCKVFSAEDFEIGYALLPNIPVLANEAGNIQIEIYNEKKLRTEKVHWYFQGGDTLFVSNNTIANILYDIKFALPESELFDSLGSVSLDSLIVPVKNPNSEALLDDQENIIAYEWSTRITEDTVLNWITIPRIDTSVTLTAVEGTFDAPHVSRIRHFERKPAIDTLLGAKKSNVFSDDSSFAISFWFDMDGDANEPDSAREDTSESIFLSAGDESLGFVIRQCESDQKAICTRIFNGIDSVATDTVEYGKSKVLDGTRHHYSLVIHKKHLAIAIDGKTVRNTDLKLADEFYDIAGIRIGHEQLQDVMLYSFGDFIRKPAERNWYYLQAWLYSYYKLQQ